MFAADQYRLLDFGRGRRLEQFGPWQLDRPCPAAENIVCRDPAAWTTAHARFERIADDQGQWRGPDGAASPLPPQWTVAGAGLTLELKPTVFGHLGIFPEQADNWNWIAARLRNVKGDSPIFVGRKSRQSPAKIETVPDTQIGTVPRVLNLFAYTGGSTLAAAAAGAEVTHVDAAGNIVAWARRNAELSGLAAAPVRWIVEDAMKFVKRELRRGNRYDAVILDPPSYGHGAHGEVWRLAKHLPRLLQLCGELTSGRRQFILLTCHTPGFTPDRLAEMMSAVLGNTDPGRIDSHELGLRDPAGRVLAAGVAVRWQREAVDCPDFRRGLSRFSSDEDGTVPFKPPASPHQENS